LGVEKIYLTGYTPYPLQDNDPRLPHLAQKTTHQIHKTALGAENSMLWEHDDNIIKLLLELKNKNYQIVGLEQTAHSIQLQKFKPTDKLALIVGNEIGGIESAIINLADVLVEIPMFGKKESFNVAQAAAISLYHIKSFDLI
jgi:tRNA G18 (ribose-2'-O)-methylase SpoU